jgi:hypothetical protein
MEQYQYRVVITDCDQGSINEEKEEFERIGAELILAQVREAENSRGRFVCPIRGMAKVCGKSRSNRKHPGLHLKTFERLKGETENLSKVVYFNLQMTKIFFA